MHIVGTTIHSRKFNSSFQLKYLILFILRVYTSTSPTSVERPQFRELCLSDTSKQSSTEENCVSGHASTSLKTWILSFTYSMNIINFKMNYKCGVFNIKFSASPWLQLWCFWSWIRYALTRCTVRQTSGPLFSLIVPWKDREFRNLVNKRLKHLH